MDVFSTIPEFGDFQDNLTGKTISHNKIVKKLRERGRGEVYFAEDINLGHQVALKFYHKALFHNKAEFIYVQGIET